MNRLSRPAGHTTPPRVALGPVPYHWSRERLDAFYDWAVASSVDIVYLGETVCPKRRSYRGADWARVAAALRQAGKEVVRSTLTLIEAASELGAVQRLCASDEPLVEVNDIGALQLRKGRPFVTGPAINIYNAATLNRLAGLGLRRWVLPLELSRDTLAALQAERPAGVETEVLVHGRMALAWSARCFTARAHHLAKDECGFCCLDYPDGMPLATREDEAFLQVNGVQLQSARPVNLIGAWDELLALGVDVVRVMPQAEGMDRVLAQVEACRQGARSPAEAARALDALAEDGTCDGYWYGEAGLHRHAG